MIFFFFLLPPPIRSIFFLKMGLQNTVELIFLFFLSLLSYISAPLPLPDAFLLGFSFLMPFSAVFSLSLSVLCTSVLPPLLLLLLLVLLLVVVLRNDGDCLFSLVLLFLWYRKWKESNKPSIFPCAGPSLRLC